MTLDMMRMMLTSVAMMARLLTSVRMMTKFSQYREHLPPKEESDEAKGSNFGGLWNISSIWNMEYLDYLVAWQVYHIFHRNFESGSLSYFLIGFRISCFPSLNLNLNFKLKSQFKTHLPLAPVANSFQHRILLHSSFSAVVICPFD